VGSQLRHPLVPDFMIDLSDPSPLNSVGFVDFRLDGRSRRNPLRRIY
jgi:hypothetical protein